MYFGDQLSFRTRFYNVKLSISPVNSFFGDQLLTFHLAVYPLHFLVRKQPVFSTVLYTLDGRLKCLLHATQVLNDRRLRNIIIQADQIIDIGGKQISKGFQRFRTFDLLSFLLFLFFLKFFRLFLIPSPQTGWGKLFRGKYLFRIPLSHKGTYPDIQVFRYPILRTADLICNL